MFDQDAHAEDTSDHITYLLSNSETLTGASGGGGHLAVHGYSGGLVGCAGAAF